MEWEMMIQATEIAGGQWQRFRDALKSADLPSDVIDLPGRTFFEFTLDCSGQLIPDTSIGDFDAIARS